MPLSSKTPGFEAWVSDPNRRAALVIAHPAHEVRILRWLSLVRPHVYILTQGSRSGADSTRRAASERLIETHGATVEKDWAGAWDRDLYDMLLDGNYAPLLEWADQLTDDFIAREVDLVVSDSWQHYNVAHELTREQPSRCSGRAKRWDAKSRLSPIRSWRSQCRPPRQSRLQSRGSNSIRLPSAKRAAMEQIPDSRRSPAIDAAEGREAHAWRRSAPHCRSDRS